MNTRFTSLAEENEAVIRRAIELLQGELGMPQSDENMIAAAREVLAAAGEA
jgi:hypothetical protein